MTGQVQSMFSSHASEDCKDTKDVFGCFWWSSISKIDTPLRKYRIFVGPFFVDGEGALGMTWFIGVTFISNMSYCLNIINVNNPGLAFNPKTSDNFNLYTSININTSLHTMPTVIRLQGMVPWLAQSQCSCCAFRFWFKPFGLCQSSAPTGLESFHGEIPATLGPRTKEREIWNNHVACRLMPLVFQMTKYEITRLKQKWKRPWVLRHQGQSKMLRLDNSNIQTCRYNRL